MKDKSRAVARQSHPVARQCKHAIIEASISLTQ
jgi:hypothetical protein